MKRRVFASVGSRLRFGARIANGFFMRRLGPLFLIGALACCTPAGHATTVPLLSAAGIPVTMSPAAEVPLEVVTRSTAVRDPLPVEGTDVSYADLEGALGHAISSATVPWAQAHRAERPGGWQLFVEIIQADSSYDGGRLIITLNTRATLRARTGNDYLAQTQARCREAGLTTPDRGAPVVYSCMTHLGRDLAGWLGGVQP